MLILSGCKINEFRGVLKSSMCKNMQNATAMTLIDMDIVEKKCKNMF